MKLLFQWLTILIYLQSFARVTNGGKQKPKSGPPTPSTTPAPPTFPYGIYCATNNGMQLEKQAQSMHCCKKFNGTCKKEKRHHRTKSNCVAQNNEELDAFKECCVKAKCSYRQSSLTTGEDC